MEEDIIKPIIVQVDPTTFEFQQYTEEDNILISSSRLDTAFSSSTDYIEYYAYDENKTKIFPLDPNIRAIELTSFSIIEGDTCLYPALDINEIGYEAGNYFSTYNFYRKLLGSDITVNYYISEISSDRTEIRLKSNVISDEDMVTSGNNFITSREESEYFVDFLLNFGNDQQAIANNFKVDTELEEPSFLIKLYEPLPPQFQNKTTLWVVEEISVSQAYSVSIPYPEFSPEDFQVISGPNYSISVVGQQGASGQDFNFNTLIDTNLTSSLNQLDNILDRKEVNINVDYTEFKNFVHFSSAFTRLENFSYKVQLIESYTADIANVPLATVNTQNSASKATLTAKINEVTRNFDGYEYFLYYNSGSTSSWPKTTSAPPYILATAKSTEAVEWLGSAEPETGQAGTASRYDADNPNYLYNAIPEYLKSDPNNRGYELFVDMVAQQYDNTWLYTKDLTNRFNADNRLDYGISRDLVADAIRDFGVKLYQGNFNTDDLYTAFLGITPSGSAFPFPNMTGSIGGVVDTPSGFEYVNTTISASNDIVPLNSVNQSVYKRIYHNIPYLLKKKGTIGGLRALITSYGIPSTILRVSEFGGRDRDFTQDWDLEQEAFNYKFHLEGVDNPTGLTSSFQMNGSWIDSPATSKSPQSLQFRFQTAGIPTSSLYQQVWVGEQTKAFITLSYTGSGFTSGSYSGSVPVNNNAYGQLRFYPEGSVGHGNGKFAQIDLPFFDKGWWAVQASFDYDSIGDKKAYLYGANRIGEEIGFSDTASVDVTDPQYWTTVETAFLPSSSALTLGPVAREAYGVAVYGAELYGLSSIDYQPLTGSLQEVRYWDVVLSESLFYDYVVNPYSTQGNSINSTPQELIFRADLGTQLNTGSRTSIHPKVTGSWEITQSFRNPDTSDFFLTGNDTGSWLQNTEAIFYNQTPGGIKNRISDKIRLVNTVIPSGSTLSPYRSVQQEVYPSGSNPSVNYLEVAFSPQNQINDDIIAQIGDFNLGEYIGDPRQISESVDSYPALDKLRDEYFEKYINSYNVNDFVRLIKFFDNSLFKMIEDFTPARTTLSSGVVIKQNLLERNKQAPPSMSYTVPEYSGSVKSFARDYNVHYAKETPGITLINDQVISASAPQNTVNFDDGRGTTTILGTTDGPGKGATFIPLLNANQIKAFQVILTGSKYTIGETITFSSASISASINALQATPGSPTSVADDISIVVGINNLAPTLGTSDFPQQNYASGSSIYRYSGGTGGIFEPFNNIYAAPISNSAEEYNYFYDYTHSISSTSIASSSLGTFAINSEDGATATKLFISSLSNGNRPPSTYSDNIYDPILRASASLAIGKNSLEVEVTQLVNYTNKVYNFPKNQYQEIRGSYSISSVNYIAPPLIGASPLRITQQPNVSFSAGGTALSFILTPSSTTGNGTGATFTIATIPTSNTFVSVLITEVGLNYDVGDTITFTSADLIGAGFPSTFTQNLICVIDAVNSTFPLLQGYWDMDVTAKSLLFSVGNYSTSSFSENIPYFTNIGEVAGSPITASYAAKFILNEGPYSGKTAAEVSASNFAHQYPGVVQKFTEPLKTQLGIGMPMGSSITESTSNVYGQAPYELKRQDQREFYNGEFINVLTPGILQDEPCKAFFGQDTRIDYFFFIQWFNDNTIPENDFISSSAAYQPQPGNNWFWADTVSFPRNEQALSITLSTTNPVNNGNVTVRTQDFTYIGQGAEGEGGVLQFEFEDNSPTYPLEKVSFVNTSLITNTQNLTNAISQNSTGGANGTYINITAASTSGTGDGAARFSVRINGQRVASVSATVQGALYDVGDTITIAKADIGNTVDDLILTLRADDLFSGVTKKYNGDRTLNVSQTALVTAGATAAANSVKISLGSQQLNPIPSNKVKYIKMSDEDINGEDTLAFIKDSRFITYTLTGAANYLNVLIDDGFETFFISNVSLQNQNVSNQSSLIFVNQEPSTAAVTSFDELFYDFSFSASGQFVYYATSSGEDPNVVHETGITRSIAQGYYPPEADSPTSLWSTESFFRGWATANWWDITNDGGLVETGIGSGFLSDPLNNFNTGSNETNNDEENPYKVSTYPWYMNAGDTGGTGGSTFLILSASSTLGSLGATDLQFYTGSITASAEKIPLAFQEFVVAAPLLTTLTETANVNPNIDSILAVNFPNSLSQLSNTSNGTQTITVTCTTDPIGLWKYDLVYNDGSGWLDSFSPFFNFNQTGDGTITFTVDNGFTGSPFSTFTRSATITIYNVSNPNQSNFTQLITQYYRVDSGGGGGFGSS